MLTTPTPVRRTAGKLLVALTAAAALPLTASRATEYVNVPSTAPTPAVAPVAQAASNLPSAPAPAAVVPAVAAAPAVAPATAPASNGELPMPDLHGVTLGKGDVAFMGDDTILIDSKRKSLDQLSPEERWKLRQALLRSQRDLARERAELPARLEEARKEIERARSGAMKRDFQRDVEDMRRDLATIDSEAAEMRAAGEDPAKRKAEILSDLHEAEGIDIDKEISEALRDADPAKITAELQSAEQQMQRILAKLNRLEGR